MKRYSNFSRSFATVSLVMLYSFATFFTPSFAAAEEVERQETITDPVELNKTLAEAVVSDVKLPEVLETESHIEEEKIEIQIEESEEVSAPVIVVEETSSSNRSSEEVEVVAENVVACIGNAPVINFASTYAETQPGGAGALIVVLSQIGGTATDVEDGDVLLTNNLTSLYPFTSGWHEIEFTAMDSDGCITIDTVDLFVFGNEYTPACESGFVYMKFDFDSSLITALGTNVQLLSGQWFPVMYDGGAFTESFSDITINHNIKVARMTGNTVLIDVNLDADIYDNLGIASGISDSLSISGGVTIKNFIVSPDNVLIEFEPTDCPEPPVCTPENNPVITAAVNSITISENSGKIVEEIINEFGVSVVDGDGEGDVTFSHNLNAADISNPGTYTITITAIDNEGCESILTLTLVVDGGSGGGGSGCVNPNGCGGSGSNSPSEEPEGEVLGEFSGPACGYYISTFLKKGANNPEDQVRKLQIFLNDYMGEELVVDGVYGNATFEAVKRFQVREFDEVLAPWGIDEATGIVRETTMRRINNIMCPELNIPVPLLFCETTFQVIYPEGRPVSGATSFSPTESSVLPEVAGWVEDNFGTYSTEDFTK